MTGARTRADRLLRTLALPTAAMAGGCAGYRGGWESVAYVDREPPASRVDAEGYRVSHQPPTLSLPELRLRVSIDNLARLEEAPWRFAW